MTLDIEKLYRTYYMKVYSYAVSFTKNSSAAEEITQNTFVKALTSKNNYKGDAKEFTWLCAIAKNLCYDYFRSESKKAELNEADESVENTAGSGSCEDDIILSETSFNIHRILHELDEPYKEVFQMRVFGELSFAEISKIFGKTESWARVTYHRARLKIKERVEMNE